MADAGTLTIASTVERIDEARTWVSEHARAAGVDEETIGEVELALTEALANVVEHAYAGEPNHEIQLSVATSADRLEVRIRDWGRAFDRGSYEQRDLDDPGDGGYGVFLIEQLIDEVDSAPQQDGGTLLLLVKLRKEGPHA